MTVNRFFSEMHFGAYFPDFNAEQMRHFGRALLCIAAADRLSATELVTYQEIGRHLGTPPEILEELAATDPASIDLEETLNSLGEDFSTHALLYDAILIASTDGYTEEERFKTAQAAEILGISKGALKSIERLVETESAQRKLKATLLKLR